MPTATRPARSRRDEEGLRDLAFGRPADLCGAVFAAQPEAPAPSYDEELSVEVINVEVYVTDRKGRPVTDLAREDFRLFEDGHPVEITYFSKIGAQSAYSGVEPLAATPEPGAEAPFAHEVSNLIIYLDDSSVSPAGRRRVLADLREALAAGSDGAERLMLVIHDGGLQIAHPLTANRQAVLAAVADLPDRVTGGFWQTRERQGALRAINEIYKRYGDCLDPCDCGWLEMEATHASTLARWQPVSLLPPKVSPS